MMKRSKAAEARLQKAAEEKSGLLKNVETAEKLKIFPLSYHADILATVNNAAIYYGEKRVCDAVTFQVRRGERIALDGKNGSGKSSILKILNKSEIEHTGTVMEGSGLVISYVPQDTSHLCGTLSEYAREHHLEEHLFKALLRKLDFERVQFEKNMKEFSEGQKKKVLIAKSLCERAHLYIWDEPLNFVDIYSRIQIEQLIQEFSPTMVFVEHDGVFRDTIATRIIRI